MAKHNPPSTSRSKVRMLFVEADLAPGDMEQLAQALTTAIRPVGSIGRGSAARQLAAVTAQADGDGDVDPLDVEIAEEVEDDEPPAPKPRGKRNYPKPQPVDMDMKAGGKPFVEFAEEKAPSSHRNRYLVAATWLHDWAKIETITVDHVFTCYKAADWTFDVSDPKQIFRLLKSEGLGGVKKGAFSINHLGIAELEKMKKTT